jgi:hypothetical protein
LQAHAGDDREQEKAGGKRGESRFEMVAVSRSLQAAKAIRAGNSKNLIAPVSMIVILARSRLPGVKLHRASLQFG